MPQPATVIFQVGETLLGLPASEVREVLLLPELARPPGLPPLLEGFLDLEGAMLPVLRLDRLFGLEGKGPGLYSHLLVLHAPLGLLADRVLRLAELSLLPVAPGCTLNDCCRAEAAVEEGTVHLLDSGRLLLEEERRRAEELAELARQRLNSLP